MKVTDIILNTNQITGNERGEALLLNVANGYEYIDGKVTDNVANQKYTVVCPTNGYEKIIVKIKGDKPAITNEQIKEKGGQVKVKFKNLTGRFYRTNSGEYAVSCSADGLEGM